MNNTLINNLEQKLLLKINNNTLNKDIIDSIVKEFINENKLDISYKYWDTFIRFIIDKMLIDKKIYIK